MYELARLLSVPVVKDMYGFVGWQLTVGTEGGMCIGVQIDACDSLRQHVLSQMDRTQFGPNLDPNSQPQWYFLKSGQPMRSNNMLSSHHNCNKACYLQALHNFCRVWDRTTLVTASGCTVLAAAMISLALDLHALKHHPYNIIEIPMCQEWRASVFQSRTEPDYAFDINPAFCKPRLEVGGP